MIGLWMSLLFLAPSFASATVMGDLAAQMQPGTWAELVTSNLTTISNLDVITGYADSAVWDPVTRRFRFIGSRHNDVAHHIVYDDATNTWSEDPIPTNPVQGHGYDHNTIDVAGRATYSRGYIGGGSSPTAPGRIVMRFDLNTSTWGNLPPNLITPYATDALGLAYFPEMGGLIANFCGENGNTAGVYLYNGTAWSRLGLANTYVMGGYHCFAEYNPVRQTVIFGGGNGSRDLYKLTAAGVITKQALAPISLGVAWDSINTVDPVTGLYLIFGAGGVFYTYDVTTDTWQLQGGTVPIFSPQYPATNATYATIVAPISTYNVVMFYKFIYNGPSKVYLYKHASSAPDTTPPSVPSNLQATAISSSQINLTWTASTDAVGVTGYRVERCQGAGCSNFAQVATPASNSHSDTGLTVSTTYQYQVRATDAAGNLSGYSLIVNATTQAGGGGGTADFNTRCTAAGVTYCTGFDVTADIDPYLPNYDCNNVRRAFLDTTVKASGVGSLRFEIPQDAPCANTSGQWVHSFGANFGQNSTFYVQFRQRFDTVMATHNMGANGWKQAVFYMPPTGCASIELTTQNTWNRGFPQMYTNCGGKPLTVDVGGGADILLQQGDYNCLYSNQNPTNCSFYQPNQWMTFYYKAHIGTWGQANSDVEAWVAYEGQPLKKFIDIHNFLLDFNNFPSDVYNTISLLPYNTQKLATDLPNPQAFTWYDELIISTQPIAAPGAGAPLAPPASPTNLTAVAP